MIQHVSHKICVTGLFLLALRQLLNSWIVLQCDATQDNVRTGTWRMRTTFPLYVVAISSTLGNISRTLISTVMDLGILILHTKRTITNFKSIYRLLLSWHVLHELIGCVQVSS